MKDGLKQFFMGTLGGRVLRDQAIVFSLLFILGSGWYLLYENDNNGWRDRDLKKLPKRSEVLKQTEQPPETLPPYIASPYWRSLKEAYTFKNADIELFDYKDKKILKKNPEFVTAVHTCVPSAGRIYEEEEKSFHLPFIIMKGFATYGAHIYTLLLSLGLFDERKRKAFLNNINSAFRALR
ncbi:MAG: hypothetical protein FWE50_00750 [Alphaproteobacteria bacterium]|nr:hypothetical protein [Alphaproteobacteria bacterium]